MLAVIETHPIQYHAPLYRLLQQRHGLPVTAIYGSDFSVAGYRDAEFGATFKWDVDLLSGYSSVFLSRVADGGAPTADEVTTRGLLATLKSLRPDTVMIVGYSPRFHRDAWLAAWRTGSRILFRGETNDDAVRRPWWKQLGRDAALRTAYRTCSRLLYVGRRSREHFERLGIASDRLVLSPYSVDTSAFDTTDAARETWRNETRQALGASADDYLFLYSGKLSWRKGVDLFVEASKELPARLRERTVLAFLGDGAMRPELEQLAQQEPRVRTVFLGFKNQRQLSRYYHAADLLVLPSRHSETWGLVVNEALHHGVPCVVSDRVGSSPDLIDAGQTGQTFKAGSAGSLSAALAESVSLCGHERVRSVCRAKVAGYTTDRAAAGIAEAYSSVVGTSRVA